MSVLRRLRRFFKCFGDNAAYPRQQAHKVSPLRSTALPKDLRIYAIGDIHGEAALLDRLANLIEADISKNCPRCVHGVFLGDYIDRGFGSRSVIERLVARDFPIPFDTLRGNHEDLLITALTTPRAMVPWCRAGGLETLRSYGIAVDKARREPSLLAAREQLLAVMPQTHRDFLEATSSSRTIGDYFFVHAGARPGVKLESQTDDDLLWIRDECYGSSYDFGKVLVHGHTPRKRPENLPGRINVDTGAFKWGVLTAAVLEGTSRRFLSTRD